MKEMGSKRGKNASRTIGKQSLLFRSNVRLVHSLWGALSTAALRRLKELTGKYGFCVAAGDLQLLDGVWYVTHAGLLRLSCQRRCAGIKTAVVDRFSDAAANRWVFRATVYKTADSKGFVGYGDADPSNVSPLAHGAEMRVAETRAVNRALRKAYGIGLCSVEELGWLSAPADSTRGAGKQPASTGQQGSGNGQPRLRDRLCLLIRQHQLDPTLVKRYAADFCGTETIREASRELVESFVNNLAEWVVKDRDGLLCKLNSYAEPKEAHP